MHKTVVIIVYIFTGQAALCFGGTSDLKGFLREARGQPQPNAVSYAGSTQMKDALQSLKIGNYDQAIDSLLHAYKYGKDVADCLGELYLLHKRDVNTALQWFQRSNSSVAMLYLWMLNKADRQLYKDELDRNNDVYRNFIIQNLQLLEDCLAMPFNEERTKKAERLFSGAIAKMQQYVSIRETIMPYLIDICLIMGHWMRFPLVPFSDAINAPDAYLLSGKYDENGFQSLWIGIWNSANKIRLTFLYNSFFLRHFYDEYRKGAIFYMFTHVSIYLLLCDDKSIEGECNKLSNLLTGTSLIVLEDRFIFVHALLGEFFYKMMKNTKKSEQVKRFLEQAQIYFFRCTNQSIFFEIKVHGLIRLAQCQYLFEALNNKDEPKNLFRHTDYFYHALKESRSERLFYYQKWCASNIYALFLKHTSPKMTYSEIFEFFNVNDSGRILESIKKQFERIVRNGSIYDFPPAFCQMVAALHYSREARMAAYCQFLGYQRKMAMQATGQKR